jgi:hypothetical protein
VSETEVEVEIEVVTILATETVVFEEGALMMALEVNGTEVVRPPAIETAETAETAETDEMELDVRTTEVHFDLVLVEVIVVVDDDVVLGTKDGTGGSEVVCPETDETTLVSTKLPPGK